MTSILLISLAIALALYLVVPKMWRNEPPKAKKQEKAEIMRQLLALSDRDDLLLANAPPRRPGAPRTTQRVQPGKLPSTAIHQPGQKILNKTANR
jgi:hypothetical protein